MQVEAASPAIPKRKYATTHSGFIKFSGGSRNSKLQVWLAHQNNMMYFSENLLLNN